MEDEKFKTGFSKEIGKPTFILTAGTGIFHRIF
jgi:hypothetical protein